MPRHSISPWRSPDSSLSDLKAVIQPNWSAIIDYPSLKMNAGIELDKLIKASAVLMGCMLLDPRGGYIRQTDLFTVIWQIVILQQYASTFQAYCSAKKHPSVQAGVGRVAYSLRVMLSHTRKSFMQWKFTGPGWKGLEVEPRSHPEKLVEIYKVMSEELPRTSKVPKSCHERSKCRRVALPRTHIKKRKSPEQESDDDPAAWRHDAQPVILDRLVRYQTRKLQPSPNVSPKQRPRKQRTSPLPILTKS